MADLYHIYIRPRADVTQKQVENTLNLAIDWLRYDSGLYLVYTSKNAKIWHARLRPFIDPGGNLLILNIDPDEYQGWMSKNIWEWIKDKKAKLYGS